MFGLIQPGNNQASVSSSDEEFDHAMHSWDKSKSIGGLADLLAFSVDPERRSQLTVPARIALASPGMTSAMRLVASEILSRGGSEDEVWKYSKAARSASNLRSLLRSAPNDVLALVDLAQHHLSHGKRRAAYRALITAFQLSPNSVHVIRSITRFWIHIGEYELAHKFIKGVDRTSSDPWLMATEIAAAEVAGLPSAQLRRAQRAITVNSFAKKDLAELAGAIGGAELANGKLKDARKLFRLALENPTDNVLAQTITNQNYLGIEVDDHLISKAPQGAFEGRALIALLAADFEAGSTLADRWSQEETFSSRPRLLQSYFEGALGNYETSLKAAEAGLSADPRDLSLRGNKAYALAALGRLEEARTELSAVYAGKDAELVPLTIATRGMIELRQGLHDEGKRSYEEALEIFERAKQDSQYTDCLAFYARELIHANASGSEEVVHRALESYRKKYSPAAAVVLRTINQKAEIEKQEPLRKVVQWEWDRRSNTIQEKRLLTAKGAPGFIVADRDQRR